MYSHSTSNEVFGSKMLTFAIIIGSALLLLAVLGAPAPQAQATTEQMAKAQPAYETVVVTAPAQDKAS